MKTDNNRVSILTGRMNSTRFDSTWRCIHTSCLLVREEPGFLQPVGPVTFLCADEESPQDLPEHNI